MLTNHFDLVNLVPDAVDEVRPADIAPCKPLECQTRLAAKHPVIALPFLTWRGGALGSLRFKLHLSKGGVVCRLFSRRRLGRARQVLGGQGKEFAQVAVGAGVGANLRAQQTSSQQTLSKLRTRAVRFRTGRWGMPQEGSAARQRLALQRLALQQERPRLWSWLQTGRLGRLQPSSRASRAPRAPYRPCASPRAAVVARLSD
jgi:hypothetical protein